MGWHYHVDGEELRAPQHAVACIGMVQVALGPVDVGGGYGQTVILQVDADKANAATVSTLKSQTGITAASSIT